LSNKPYPIDSPFVLNIIDKLGYSIKETRYEEIVDGSNKNNGVFDLVVWKTK